MASERTQLWQVDAFTEIPFEGNPAAVCLLPFPRDDDWMMSMAAEMNLSETAFLVPVDDGWRLRWFTPTTEVSLCGHATLAAAHALWEAGCLGIDLPAQFHTASGVLTAVRRQSGSIEMDFPAKPPEATPPPDGLAKALGIEPRYCGYNGMDWVAVAELEAIVRGLSPNLDELARIDCRGVIVTALGDASGYDFVSRCFYPASGVPEDPVTGSAHCLLGPYWRDVTGKSDFTAYQASSRGGVVRVYVRGDRVLLTGFAVTVFHGELKV